MKNGRKWHYSPARQNILLSRLLSLTLFIVLTFSLILPAWASDKETDTVYLGRPEHVWWESDSLGKWTSVKKAHEYQVKLFIVDYADRDEDNSREIDVEDEMLECVMTKRISGNECDFSGYMDDLHSYCFAVRATPKYSEQAYVVNGEWTASKDIDFREKAVNGIIGGRWRNYLEGSRYEDANGEFLEAGWHLIEGRWYLLDDGGYRLDGWQEADGKRYYLDEKGRMAEGWFLFDGDWYYADKSGEVQTGWIRDLPGEYYYLDENGVMLHDCEIDGYWLASDGMRKDINEMPAAGAQDGGENPDGSETLSPVIAIGE